MKYLAMLLVLFYSPVLLYNSTVYHKLIVNDKECFTTTMDKRYIIEYMRPEGGFITCGDEGIKIEDVENYRIEKVEREPISYYKLIKKAIDSIFLL